MTDTPGWMPPTEPGGSEPEHPPSGYGPTGTPPPGSPGSWGAQPGAWDQQPGAWGQQPGGWGQPGAWGQQPGWGGAAPGAPHGYAPPGSFGWGRPAAPEPGIVPLRPLGLGEILDGAFTAVRQYPRVTLGLSAIVVTTTQLMSFGLSAWPELTASRGDPDAFYAFIVTTGLGLLITTLGTMVLAGMLTSVMGDAVLGRTPTIGDTWRKVRPRFWALIGAGFLGALVPFLGLLLCIAPGVFLWGAWAFLTPVVVLERAGVIRSIRRSWRLAVPDFWRVWGIRALSTLIAVMIAQVFVLPITLAVSVPSALSESEPGILGLAFITLGQILASTVTAPFTSGVLALLYIDRRMRAEGLDVTLAQAAAQQAGVA